MLSARPPKHQFETADGQGVERRLRSIPRLRLRRSHQTVPQGLGPAEVVPALQDTRTVLQRPGSHQGQAA